MIAEVVTNNNKLISTNFSPFFTIKNWHPCISFDIIELSNTSICGQIFKHKTLHISENI